MKKTHFLYLGIVFLCLTACTPKQKDEKALHSKEATQLLEFLNSTREHNVMFGMEDTLAYGVGWQTTPDKPWDSDVFRSSNQFPAIFGWDLGHIEQKNNIDGVPFDHIRQWIQQVNARGGINTISWHALNPVTGDGAWIESSDLTGYIKSILPGGSHHAEYLLQLEEVGNFLVSLRDKNGSLIPILFRPFHEFEGNWFWWTATRNSDEDFIALWRFTIDYLRNERGADNLLLCYNPGFSERIPQTCKASTSGLSYSNDMLRMDIAERYYPGDGYVDLIGIDIYWHSHEEYSNRLTTKLEYLIKFASEKGKIPCLSETGHGGIEANDGWWTDILLPIIKDKGLAYVLVWRNDPEYTFFVPTSEMESSSDFKAFTDTETIMMLKDLQNSQE